MNSPTRKLEKAIAAASFFVAAALAFLSLLISESHDMTASQLMMVAQFLTLTATLLGIDYKFNSKL